MYGGSVIDIETSLATHALDELRALSGVMEVTRDDETHLHIVTEGSNNVVPQVINILSRESELRNLVVREPNLDEIFLRLTGKAIRD